MPGKISDVIKMLEAAKAEHGDLECFDANHRLIESIDVHESGKNEFPKDWNMPKKFVLIGEPD